MNKKAQLSMKPSARLSRAVYIRTARLLIIRSQ